MNLDWRNDAINDFPEGQLAVVDLEGWSLPFIAVRLDGSWHTVDCDNGDVFPIERTVARYAPLGIEYAAPDLSQTDEPDEEEQPHSYLRLKATRDEVAALAANHDNYPETQCHFSGVSEERYEMVFSHLRKLFGRRLLSQEQPYVALGLASRHPKREGLVQLMYERKSDQAPNGVQYRVLTDLHDLLFPKEGQ